MANLEEFLGTDIAFKGDFLRTATGDLDTISGLESVKNALFHRLITTPGTLIHRPDFGVGIKDFQNAPATLDSQRQLALRIKEQFELDPRVEEVIGVRMNVADLTPDKITVTVRVKIRGYDEEAMEFIPFGEGV
jgi:hypothetical protein